MVKKIFKPITSNIRITLEKLGLYPIRADFLKILPQNGIGAELGVFQGKFSKDLITVTKPKKLHLIDPWWVVTGAYYGDWSRHHNNGELLATKKAFEQAKANVAKANGAHIAQFHIADDVAILQSMSENSLDWAYIDSTHLYEHTVKELNELERLIKPKGIIAGHDWHPNPNHRHYGVYQAVTEFCASNNWEIIKIDKLFTQWAIKRKAS